jgi:hypothetical protein
MATTAITAESLEVDELSADLPDAGGGSGNGVVADTPADGWVISAEAGRSLADGKLMLRLVANGTGDTFTVTAGDAPPSHRSGMGAKSYVLAASDVKFVALDAGRYLQNDGTLIITCTDTGSTLTALHQPRGV